MARSGLTTACSTAYAPISTRLTASVGRTSWPSRHEIGHVLGFVTGLALVDEAHCPRPRCATGTSAAGRAHDVGPVSLLVGELAAARFDTRRHGLFFARWRRTALASVTTGVFNGDGFDPAHWTPGHGLMDPTWPDWVAVQLQPLDLQAMDVIGWDLVAVPEPATGVLALCAAGWWMLTRRFMRASSGGGGT